MKSSLLMEFSVDKENNQINVKREFTAPVADVWAAWTQPEILDKWWAPRPWQSRTKFMDFKNGGRRLYAMVGPEGEEHWCLADYREIHAPKSFKQLDAFCDSEGNINTAHPRMNWSCTFNDAAGSTIVDINIKFENLADLEKILEMGFKEGFTLAIENLDEIFSES